MITSTTFKKGHKVTPEMRLKISNGMKGNKNPSGRKVSPDLKDRIRKWMSSRVISESTKQKISATLTGRKIPFEIRMKMGMKGCKNPAWKGGVSAWNKTERQIAMQTKEYRIWREAVFERDDYTCQECGTKGSALNADHIKPWRDYPELRLAIDNGRTLCVDCHRKTRTYSRRKY